jgi:uncharacterized protein with HEPN domain
MRDKEILKERLYESFLHKKRLLHARHSLKFIMPLTVEKYNELDDIFISIIDQMLFRFTKLQDTLGERVFLLILQLEGEAIKKMSFIDRLNRLEELEIVDRLEWMSLRSSRNEIAHEYSYNIVDIVENINFIYNKSQNLIDIFEKIYSYCHKKFNINLDEIKG